ncbi:hypothetical protein [Thalassotalea fusca]
MSELSSNTKSLVHKLYKSGEAREICDILENKLAAEILGCSGWTPKQMERIHFAALKLAINSESGLDNVLELATRDWRDLLVVAGFAEDLDAHEEWYESFAN